MLYTVLSILIVILQTYMVGFFFHLMLTPKYRGNNYILIWLVRGVILAVQRVLFYNTATQRLICMITNMTLWLLALLWGYKDGIIKCLMAMVIIDIAAIINDMIILAFITITNIVDINSVYTISLERVMITFFGSMPMFVLHIIILKIWNLFFRRSQGKGIEQIVLMFVVMFLLVASIEGSIWNDSDSNYRNMMMMGMVFLCLNFLYWIGWLIAKAQQSELEKSIKELEEKMEAQHRHYQEIEQKREVLSKLRHDMNNQIQTIRSLVETENTKDAEVLIGQVRGLLSYTNE